MVSDVDVSKMFGMQVLCVPICPLQCPFPGAVQRTRPDTGTDPFPRQVAEGQQLPLSGCGACLPLAGHWPESQGLYQ
jgi:hypothetical protein